MWRPVRGATMQMSVTVGAAALTAGDPIKLVDGLAVAAGDGDRVDGVMHGSGDPGEKVFADLLVPGTVWEAPVSSLTAKAGTKLAAAASGVVDSGTSGDPSFGWIVDGDVASSDTVVHFVVERGSIA